MINLKAGYVTPGPQPDLDKGKAARAKANQDRMRSESFEKACAVAGVEATKRQASKFNNQKGRAYLAR